MNGKIKIVNKSDNPTPVYQTAGAAGFDLASNDEDFVLMPGERRLVNTGLYMEIPAGYEMQIRPRSGLASKHGVTVLNTPGTIDSDYRGEIKVLLWNSNPALVPVEKTEGDEGSMVKWNNASEGGVGICLIKKGERIAQGVISKHETAIFVEVEELSSTERGAEGFGSTGKS